MPSRCLSITAIQRGAARISVLLLAVAGAGACGGSGAGGSAEENATAKADPASNLTPCVPAAPPSGLELDPFYEKYCDGGGIPVLSSSEVPDRALERVASQARAMLELRPELASPMQDLGIRIGIMAAGEVTTDIPEHSDLYEAFPGTDWDTRARGLGATPVRPASTAAEENVLCYTSDRYRGENIFIHEFAHTIHETAIRALDTDFDARLTAAYEAAMEAGLWSGTYAATNEGEYWAEGVQSWFNANREADPADGIHNHVNTRSELSDYDPALHRLVSEFMPASQIPRCPVSSRHPG